MQPDPLTLLAIRHGTDKFGQHLYTPIYHRLFSARRDAPLRLLEIGVGWPGVSVLGGASLAMWRDYFPSATLFGLDVQPKRLDLGPRVQVVQGSQSDRALLHRLCAAHGPFDVVIDDGSHLVADVLASFDVLYPVLAEDGVYAVEDVQTAFWPDFGGNAEGERSIVSRAAAIMRAMHAPEAAAAGLSVAADPFGAITSAVRVHRNLVVFERGANDFPSNRAFALAHPSVRAVLDTIAAAGAAEPSVGAVLVQLGMLEVAGDLPTALAVARAGLDRFPHALALLAVQQHLAWQLGHAAESRAAVAQLRAMMPDEPLFAAIAQRIGA